MKKQYHYLIFMVTIFMEVCMAVPPSTCNILGAPCTCPQIGHYRPKPGVAEPFLGYCLPFTVEQMDISWMSPAQQAAQRNSLSQLMDKNKDKLSCDCKSDVLSEDEVVTEIIKKYYENAKIRHTGILITEFVAGLPKSHEALEAIRKILGDNPKDFNPPNIQQERKNLMIAMRQEPLLYGFYILDKGCKYVNQKCICKNGITMGVCGIGRYWMNDTLTCYCG